MSARLSNLDGQNGNATSVDPGDVSASQDYNSYFARIGLYELELLRVVFVAAHAAAPAVLWAVTAQGSSVRWDQVNRAGALTPKFRSPEAAARVSA